MSTLPATLPRPGEGGPTTPPARPRAVPPRVRDAARMLLILAALCTVFGLSAERFFSARTLMAVSHQIPALLVAAVGMTFVLVLGQIDLSVGSVLALAGAIMGLAMSRGGLPLPVAALAALATGAAVGAGSAWLSLRFALPTFIVTLGMLEAARGATYLVTGSQTQYLGGAVDRLAEATVLGLSAAFWLALALVALGQLVLSRTVFGRHCVATGTSEEAVRLSGIDTRRVRLLAFALCGALTGLAAVIHTARMSAADPNAGAGFELQAIAAVVIGGTSLMGGRASVTGTLFGVLVIAILDTGLAQVGAQEPVKRLITGLVIVLAVILDNLRHGRGRNP